MSVSADRLRLLRRQAGQTDVRGPVGGEAATSARVEAADALRVDGGARAGAAVKVDTSVAVGSGAQASVDGSTASQRAAVAVDGTRADSAAANATAGEPLDAPSNAVSARDLATYADDLQPLSMRRDAGMPGWCSVVSTVRRRVPQHRRRTSLWKQMRLLPCQLRLATRPVSVQSGCGYCAARWVA